MQAGRMRRCLVMLGRSGTGKQNPDGLQLQLWVQSACLRHLRAGWTRNRPEPRALLAKCLTLIALSF